MGVKSSNKLTLEQIGELFYVIPEEGWVFWKYGLGRRPDREGREAGTEQPCGRQGKLYRLISVAIDGVSKLYRAHCIIWACVHGEWPDFELDHISGDSLDNRIDNLRPEEGKNMLNSPRRVTNKSGLKWVSWNTRQNEWQARVIAGDVDRAKYFKAKERAYAWAFAQAWELHGEFFHHGFEPGKYPMHPMDIL